MKRLLLILGLALALTACGESADEGIVISKGHHDEYYTYIPVCTKGCIIVPVYHPESWWITIQDCRKAVEEGDQPESAVGDTHPLEHCLRGDISTTADYNGYDIGDWYGDNPPLLGNR